MKEFLVGGNLSTLEDDVSSDELAWDHAMDISGSVYARLKELSMSNKDLATILDVTPGRVSQILKGYPGMSLKMLAKLEVALDFRLDSGFKYSAQNDGISDAVELSLPSQWEGAWGKPSKQKPSQNMAPQVFAMRGVVAA